MAFPHSCKDCLHFRPVVHCANIDIIAQQIAQKAGVDGDVVKGDHRDFSRPGGSAGQFQYTQEIVHGSPLLEVEGFL